jgi:hypothetical protein
MRRHPKTSRRRFVRTKVVLAVVVLLLVAPAISFTQAMTYPGNAPYSVRAVEWVRDHGGGGVVDRVETWIYSRQAPAAQGTPANVVVVPRAQVGSVNQPTHRLPASVTTVAAPLPGEGQWQVVRRTAKGLPAVSVTWFRVDPQHLPVSVAAALLPRDSIALHLSGGTREPKPDYIPVSEAQVPGSMRGRLAAVFNAGFKMRDTGGGWYRNGQSALPLSDGMASLVIDRNGHATIGAWGTDVRMGPDVVAVRQNLHLIVKGGAPVAGLATNNRGQFGTGKNQFQYTWRSAIGTRANGDLVYVAGTGLNLHTLAAAVARAGAVTAMELDIHSQQVAFNYFLDTSEVLSGTSHNLLAGMHTPTLRYLVPDQRDFFYATVR